ncbi:homoserine dehydrogenase [Rossellomorea vietnamensis]|uniref:Homoserine dehydrogenase n=1 Tax=Rossellomorea vietnamensis TaxID=218284 RepID=A0A5D4MDB6_9BACI|nr:MULTISPECIES: homoserine dehydrogenase [Bacillaceae]TYR99939.1 homoserine dehydrogenase [Rossellomorea vietnamensis]
MEKISIGLLGLGTVGSGVVKVIRNHQDKLVHGVGCSVEIKKILVQDIEKIREVEVVPEQVTLDANEIVEDPDIDIIVEVMGGIEDTRKLLLKALEKKKHVVTANKDLMALHGPELLETASKNGCDLFYEASVAGGIPILRSVADGFASDRIHKIIGIVNGTTNYILTKMSDEGKTYEEALKGAQDLGFAESDPEADVEGTDAARKMAILSTLGFSMNVGLDDVRFKGITNVSQQDIEYGKRLGYTMKLIGVAERDGEKIDVTVQPAMVTDSHPLAAVKNENNAVYVYGEAVGETMFYGPGAGSLPTATAVVSDLVGVMRNMRLGVNGHSAVFPQFPKKMMEADEVFKKYFIRLIVEDEVGTLAEVTSLFSNEGISVEKIWQNPKRGSISEIVLVTHKASRKSFQDIIVKLNDSRVVKHVGSFYRIEI